MSIHWTYRTTATNEDLQQGDILFPTTDTSKLFEKVHPHFCDKKYLAFMVITQSCDLVLRKGQQCRAQYIELAVIRSLSQILTRLMDSVCSSVAPGVFLTSSKQEAHRLVERIINQNEQSLGLFYLHPEAEIGIADDAVSLLRVSVAVRREHYPILQAARVGGISSDFQAKLGWLIGTLYSRVGTRDWTDNDDGHPSKASVITRILRTGDAVREPVWVDDEVVQSAQQNGVEISAIERAVLVDQLEQHRPRAPLDQVIDRVKEAIAKVDQEYPQDKLAKIANRLNNDGPLRKLLRR